VLDSFEPTLRRSGACATGLKQTETAPQSSMDGFVPVAQGTDERKGENSYLMLKRLPLAGSKDIIECVIMYYHLLLVFPIGDILVSFHYCVVESRE